MYRSMKRYVLKTKKLIHPFESPAAELPVLNRTIFENQEDVFRHLKVKEKPFFVSSLEEVIPSASPTLFYSDDIFFNKELVLRFLDKASAVGKPARIAFSDTYPCISLLLAVRSIIWNTWGIYFWETFSFSRLKCKRGISYL